MLHVLQREVIVTLVSTVVCNEPIIEISYSNLPGRKPNAALGTLNSFLTASPSSAKIEKSSPSYTHTHDQREEDKSVLILISYDLQSSIIHCQLTSLANFCFDSAPCPLIPTTSALYCLRIS